MKKVIFCFAVLMLIFFECSEDFLDRKPTDKLDGGVMFSDPEGVKLFMANLYYQLPIEDFAFFRNGFNWNSGDPNNGGFSTAMQTDEAVHSNFNDWMRNEDFEWWVNGYKLIRDVNYLISEIPSLSIPEQDKKTLLGESSFIRAFAYFGLAKRYGGVPLIKEVQRFDGDAENLKVPRNTEKETWDYILEQCDIASNNLPTTWEGGQRRATKWVAYALKSRAALFAASIAKHWSKSPLSGKAVDQKLTGIEASEAIKYYTECIHASEAIMNSGVYSLFRGTPTTAAEAAENYRAMFEDPAIASDEIIFIKGFAKPGVGTAHNYDIWYTPNQLSNGWPHPGRMNPTLELVDLYESYTSNGESSPIVTTEDGNILDYNGYNKDQKYLYFDTPDEIFKDKDARLWGTVVLPGTIFKGKTIIIQGGYVLPDGNAVIETKASYTLNGVTYHSYGAADWAQYSGFDTYGSNMTRTGFSFKKFLDSRKHVIPSWNQSITDWIEFRYAEILLNYAEAVVECNYKNDNAQIKATKAINDIRRRAAFLNEIPLTLQNVIRERRIELAFENKRYWDLIRRREFDTQFNNTRRHALVPLLDLRVNPAKYIFVRKIVSRETSKTFAPRFYYRPIPGIGSNGLVQNPQY